MSDKPVRKDSPISSTRRPAGIPGLAPSGQAGVRPSKTGRITFLPPEPPR